MESIAFDLEHYLRRLGQSAKASSFMTLRALLTEDPFAPEGLLGIHPPQSPVLVKSLLDPTEPPDLSGFIAAKEAYLEVFNRVMDENRLDVLVFPQMAAELPGIFEAAQHPATTVSEINIAGLPGVTVPAGQFANGSPFALILVGRMWSEAELLAFAYDYEQASRLRIVPELVETPYIAAT